MANNIDKPRIGRSVLFGFGMIFYQPAAVAYLKSEIEINSYGGRTYSMCLSNISAWLCILCSLKYAEVSLSKYM